MSLGRHGSGRSSRSKEAYRLRGEHGRERCADLASLAGSARRASACCMLWCKSWPGDALGHVVGRRHDAQRNHAIGDGTRAPGAHCARLATRAIKVTTPRTGPPPTRRCDRACRDSNSKATGGRGCAAPHELKRPRVPAVRASQPPASLLSCVRTRQQSSWRTIGPHARRAHLNGPHTRLPTHTHTQAAAMETHNQQLASLSLTDDDGKRDWASLPLDLLKFASTRHRSTRRRNARRWRPASRSAAPSCSRRRTTCAWAWIGRSHSPTPPESGGNSGARSSRSRARPWAWLLSARPTPAQAAASTSCCPPTSAWPS